MDVERSADVELIESCRFMFMCAASITPLKDLTDFVLRIITQNFFGLQTAWISRVCIEFGTSSRNEIILLIFKMDENFSINFRFIKI